MKDDRIQQLQQVLNKSEAHAQQALGRQLQEYDPINLAELLEYFGSPDKTRLFNALEPKIAAEVLDETDRESREQILSMLSVEHVADVVKEMPPDEGADIIQQLSLETGRRVLDALGDSATELEELIAYQPDTAGGIMTTDCLWGKETETVAQVLARIGKERNAEHVGEVFVLDRDERLQGVVSIKTLFKQSPSAKLNALMKTEPLRATPEMDQEDVANLVNKYNLPSLPVVDDHGVLKGVITLDDVMDVIEEEMDEDIFRIAGSLSKDMVSTPVARKYLKRIPFLLSTFLGGIMTIAIQYFFRFSTEALVAITFFIPIINGLSGNVGLQSSTIMVRGFATGGITLDRVLRLLPREVATGAMIGLTFGTLCGTITALLAAFINAAPLLGLVVGASMCTGTIVASILGVVVPSLCEKLGIDPAVSAGPFIATLLDSTALLIYLGFATVMLRHIQI